jgi:YVTN family beta-propeller protein
MNNAAGVPVALAAILIAAACFVAVAAQAPQTEAAIAKSQPTSFPAPTNLKVLPKDLTGQQVRDMMEQWKVGLGMSCSACHAEDEEKVDQNGRPLLDFASDSKPEKATARLMYSMTEEINQNYITKIDSSGVPVTCGTCHHGHVGLAPFLVPSGEERAVPRGLASSDDYRFPHESGGAIEELDYASPLEILFSADGARLYVLCQESEEVRVLDAASHAVIRNIAVGRVPRGFSLSPDGARLFVTNSWDDTLSVIDTSKLAVVATWPVGMEPSSVISDRVGMRLFVANRISNDVAVLNAQTGAEEKRLLAVSGSSYLALSPDRSRIYVTHVYSNPSPLRTGLENRTAPESEITVIDVARAVVVDRIPLHQIAGVFHVALSADGRLALRLFT